MPFEDGRSEAPPMTTDADALGMYTSRPDFSSKVPRGWTMEIDSSLHI